MKYYETPSGMWIAAIGKAGSSAIARALVEQKHKEKKLYYGADMSNNPGWQYFAKKTENPDNTILILVRNPIERFRSACAQSRIEVEEALTKLEIGDHFVNSFEFALVTSAIKAENKCLLYKFPDHIDKLAEDAGIIGTLPKVNVRDNRIKPTLNSDQLTRVIAHYIKDIDLFNSISNAGQEYIQKYDINSVV